MNGSTVTEFIFLDFSCSRTAELFLFTLVLAVYTTILLGNLLIMVTVRSDPHLFQSPMYLFLANLSLLDMSFGSVATPKLMTDILISGGRTISFGGCMAQIFGLHFFGGAETFLLSLMAYDRYVAICHPLRYTTIMDQQHCFTLLILCWAAALIHGIVQTVVMAQLPFCGPNVLDHFVCEIPQLVKLACSDVYVVEIVMVISDSIIIVPCLLSLLASYATILATLSGHFRKGGRKALSTCSSHLTIVCLFYGPAFFVYLKPSSSSQVDKIASMFYVAVTPALNPLIYTLRNQGMMEAMKKLYRKFKVLLQLPDFCHFPLKTLL